MDHARRKPDAFTPYDQWREIVDHAKSREGITYAPTCQYMGEDPEQVARRDRMKLTDTLNAYGF